MKTISRTTALVVGLVLVAVIAIIGRRGPAGDTGVATAGLDPTALLHTQEQESHGEESSGDPEQHGEGETAVEAAQYAAEQDTAEQPPQWRAITLHETATRGPEQPIPFSHRFHVSDLEISCEYCHIGTEKSVSGVVPPVSICMGCHQVAGTGLPPIMDLRGYWQRQEPIPWKWVNKLPEFVQFSHQPHVRTGIECAECHGPVEEMDRVYQWASLEMGWCLDCHRQEPRDTDVATNYVLTSIDPPVLPPDNDQEGSPYPRMVSSDYGAYRGPIDCAACHH